MNVLQMSISAAVLILVIVAVRQLAIHKLLKNTFVLLWGIVSLRLLIPLSITIPALTFFNAEPVFNETTGTYTEIRIAQGTNFIPIVQPYTDVFYALEIFNNVVPRISESIAPTFPIITVWIAGIVILALFFLITHFRCRKEYAASLPVDIGYINKWLQEQKMIRPIQVRHSDRINAPLTYGVWKPVILFPKTTDWKDEAGVLYVLTHELTHIKRFDVLTKWLLAAALCIHWFNPLVWVMYILANRDIELSCDEAVVRTFGETTKSAYALTLIGLEEKRSISSPLCTNFANNAIKERINSIMKIKKISLTGVLASLVLVVAATTGAFATTSANENTPITSQTNYQSQFNIEVPELIGAPEGFSFGEPTTNCISIEEAAQIAASGLERFFGADLQGVTMNMHYMEGGPSSTLSLPYGVPATWVGSITPGNDLNVMAQFAFTVNAETGELLRASYFPGAVEAAAAGAEWPSLGWNDGDFDYINPNAQHNRELANLAMDIVQELNILDGEIARARINFNMIGATPLSEPTMITSVDVQCVNGETVALGFQGFFDEEQVLTDVFGAGQTQINESMGWERHESKFDWVNR